MVSVAFGRRREVVAVYRLLGIKALLYGWAGRRCILLGRQTSANFFRSSRRGDGGDGMVAFCTHGKPDLTFIQGIMDSARYVSLLADKLLPCTDATNKGSSCFQ